MTEEATPRKQVDWEAIERDYRAGILSLREIAQPHGVTEGAIRKRAKRDLWERDLEAKIRAEAESLVRKAEVRKSVRENAVISDKEIIQANAQAIADVAGGQKAIAARMVSHNVTLLAELEGQTTYIQELEHLGELMINPDEKGLDKLNEIYRKVISTAGRVDASKKNTEALKIAISVQRECWGMDDKKSNNAPPGDISITF